MANTFWKGVVTGLENILVDIEKGLEQMGMFFMSLIGKIITAEENQLMADALPLVQKVAQNIQNQKPGLNAQDFVSELIAAAIPVLASEGIVLAHTAIAIVASTVAHELTVPNASGNAGNFGGPATPSGTTT